MGSGLNIQIIGHGLTGAVLAETLAGRGFRISVYDDGGPSSSRVAAGMYTPLTGRRLIPSWSLDKALPRVNSFYPALQKTLDRSFFFPLSTSRIFRNAEERSEWKQNSTNGFTKALDTEDLPFRTPFGGCEIMGGGWVDLPVMLDALKKRRQAQGEWGKIGNAGCTIWAEGVRAAENPLWKEVGWRNARGDILTLRIPGLAENHIYNFGKFLVPLGNHQFRCGATYDWEFTDPSPREQGRKELEEEISSVLMLPFEVLDHRAGVRPVAKARVPVAGPHPEHPDQWIFNGFGSKGVLMAPWMAECVAANLQSGDPLPKETRAEKRIQRERDRVVSAKGQSL